VTPLLFVDGVGDASDQRVGNAVTTTVGDHLAELGLETRRARARFAKVEMPGDLAPAILGELPVEVVVELMDRLVTIHPERIATGALRRFHFL
jgi:hypothetical protein